MINDSLGNRMKSFYENSYRISLPMRMPIIIRVDGKNFTNWTRECERPFDQNLVNAMDQVAIELCKEIQGAKLAYLQSDEISVLVVNYSALTSEAWFNNNLQKIVSVSAAIASSTMTEESIKIFGKIKKAQFDSRSFVLPKEEVNNYFLFRQKDATKNSIQMLARAHFSQKELHSKNNSQIQDMLMSKGINWNNLPTSQKRGRCIIKNTYIKDGVERSKWETDNEIPIFSQDTNYINSEVFLELENKNV